MQTDALVIGGGLAGLFAVLHLPDDWEVVVVDKGTARRSGSSPLAQGGMAVAVGPDDSPELHAQDTLRAGAGACHPAAVEVLVSEAPSALEALMGLGCEFDRTPEGALDLHREGGQSVHRSVHAADATGRELMRALVPHARRRATRVTGGAVSLSVLDGRCVGAVVSTPEGPLAIRSRGVLLATGGCGALYASTTNEDLSTGDGIALAAEAGAATTDLEFVQFHPTALGVGDGTQRALLTEALRGDGATLLGPDGWPLMDGVHPDRDLAPRDVVARAIAAAGPAVLDMRPVGADRLERRFPNVVAAVRRAGFDPVREPVPVTPAAHYLLGGVATDLWGRTSLDGLYAAGECAGTGVHGANRMAGNSLTEAVVFGRRAAIALAREAPPGVPGPPAGVDPVPEGGEPWDELRAAMWAGAGLSRTDASLRETAEAVGSLAEGSSRAFALAALTSSIVCRAARIRTESRGVHHRLDHPAPDPAWEGAHVRLGAVKG
ncbi:MAG TPA: L-aspartate oxidase [Actinomycetota bacterium]|nr:L-aspartate oxidase [Actinomycetota bacterium]